jgi:MFS family permease
MLESTPCCSSWNAYTCDRSNRAEHSVRRLRTRHGIRRLLLLLIDLKVLMQVPSNALLNFSGRPSWYIGFWVIAWGLVSALTSQVHNYGEIVACRFILGFVEAPFFCGILFYLSKWYTKEELSFRMAIFYSASLLSGAFGSLIAAGILNGLDGARGLAPWQVR